jgi:FdrA protein
MLASQEASKIPSVNLAAAMQATPLNIGMLEVQGFSVPTQAGPNDLVIAVRAESEDLLDVALAQIDAALVARVAAAAREGRRSFRSWRELKRTAPAANLAMIAVAGRYAATECAAALDADLDVFCFSDGVSVEHEVAFKRWALSNDRLFMGPDCGTAIIGGVGLGFANRVEPGPVGIIGASGTGTQEICALLDRAGVGISHAIGVGSRDLGATVQGLMTLHAIDLLGNDASTEVIVIVSKPPDPAVAVRIGEAAGRQDKPIVMAALGPDVARAPGVTITASMEAAVAEVCALLGREPVSEPDHRLRPIDGFVRGVFCGGTLCYQAQLVLLAAGIKVRSNTPLDPALNLDDVWSSEGHTFLDLGDDVFTDGRLHPMIDPSLRDARVKQEATDPEVGLIMCDVVLGDGAHADPAGDLAAHIVEAKRSRDDLQFVVALCGTKDDPQDVERQARVLMDAGAQVARSTESAARSVVTALGASS